MRLHRLYIAVIHLSLVTFIGSCGLPAHQASNSRPISHNMWDTLLKRHVDDKGLVDYKGVIADSIILNQYLDQVSQNHPNEQFWTKDEILAYWINAYNAYTVRLIIRHYPLTSIKNIAGSIPFVNTSWDIKFIQIEGHTYDLNNIEHSIIRPNFDEPRIHFALVCAAISCPKLLNEAYTAEKIDQQLDLQASDFINNPSKNHISGEHIQLSKLFNWYKSDFTSSGHSLISFLNLYAKQPIQDDAEISFNKYHWELNEQK